MTQGGTNEPGDARGGAPEGATAPDGRDVPDAATHDARLTEWLKAAGAPATGARRITEALGPGAAQRVLDDPWTVLDIPGIAPPAADALARAALADVGQRTTPADPRRTRALIGWLLRRAAAHGETVQGADVVACALTAAGVEDPTGAIADAIEHGGVLAFGDRVELSPDADEDESGEFEELDTADDDDPAAMLTSARTLLGLEQWAFIEQSAAEAVQRLVATAQPLPRTATPDSGDRAPDPLIAAAAEHGVTLATGVQPDEIVALVKAFPNAVFASPSPGGARTLLAAGAPPLDLRAIAEDLNHYTEAELVIVADAQAVPLDLGTALLEALPDGAHLVLIGDPGVLPAAGPGRLLRDLLAIDDPQFGGKLPRVDLKHRPSGPLSALADAVRHGGLPPRELLTGADGDSKEVVIVPVRDDGEAVHRAVQLAVESIPRAFDLTAAAVQVVTVSAAGAVGADELNKALKSRLNPGAGVCGGFDKADRVLVATPLNVAGLNVAGPRPGAIGTVLAASAERLTVLFDAPHDPGAPVEIEAQAVDALRHAWALPVRDAAGGQWPAVVAVFDQATAGNLNRAVVLDAISRATVHLSVVHGAGRMLAEAVEQIPERPCRTRLPRALGDD